MIIFILLLNFLFTSEPFKTHRLFKGDMDTVLVEKIICGAEKNALSAPKRTHYNYIYYSTDLGRSFKEIGKIDYTPINVKTINSVGYSDNKFILFLEDGLIYRVSSTGEIEDTLELPFKDTHMTTQLNAFNSEYIIAIGTRGGVFYDVYETADTTLYNMYLSDNGFKTFKRLEIDEIKYGNNWIRKIEIVENNIYFCISESRKIPNTDPIEYKNDDYLTTFNIKTNEYKKLFKLDYNLIGEYIEDFYITENKDIFIAIGKNNNIKKTEYINLFKLVDSNLIFIDTLYAGTKSSVRLKSYICNDYLLFYSFPNSKIKKINVDDNSIDSTLFSFSYFNNEGEYSNSMNSSIWKDEETNTFLMNVKSDVIYEFDLDYLFSISSIEKETSLSNMIIYPNPAQSGQVLNIDLKENAERIVIYDLLGKELMCINQHNKKYKIQTNSLKKGLYILIIEYANTKKLANIIIE